MRISAVFLYLLPMALWAAPEWLLIRTMDGTTIEAQTITAVGNGKVLTLQNGVPASVWEAARIAQDLAAVQGDDRAARDKAVEELTAIGLPVVTPLLQVYKDTDQHEPRPLYRLFERVMPGYADDFDRTLSLTRYKNGEATRGKFPEGSLEFMKDGKKSSLPWAQIRFLAVRRASVQKSMHAHSLRHSTQIEYLDTGVMPTAASKITVAARGLVRLSWDTDSWASDADGLKVPGSPAYKSNLVDGQPFGALVGRFGAAGDVFFIGRKASFAGKTGGRLGIAVNDNKHWQNNVGAFSVTLTATDAYDLGDAQ